MKYTYCSLNHYRNTSEISTDRQEGQSYNAPKTRREPHRPQRPIRVINGRKSILDQLRSFADEDESIY